MTMHLGNSRQQAAASKVCVCVIVCEHTVQCANDVCVCVSVVYPITLRLIIVIAIYSMETDRTVFFCERAHALVCFAAAVVK